MRAMVVVAMTVLVTAFSAGRPPQSAAKAEVAVFTADNFNRDVLQSSIPVVVFFYATWSLPSKQQLPAIKELAADYAGRAAVGKVDADANDLLLHQLGVSNLPTTRIYKRGQLVQSIQGVVPKKALAAALNRYL